MKSIDWKEAHDMQQKLVVHYVSENEKLKDRIKELEAPSESVEKICKQIEEIYRQNEYYRMHNHILETANDDLATTNEAMKDTLINIWECYEIRDEIYDRDWHALQALANKARICLEEIGYEWRNDK
jgi:cell division protein FtsB